MKLSDILQEGLTAPVSNTLRPGVTAMLGFMLAKDGILQPFSLPFKNIVYGCLAGQMVYTISTISGIPHNVLVTAIDNNVKEDQGKHGGTTLPSLMDFFDKTPIVYNGTSHKINMHVEVFHALQPAIDEVLQGQPVIMIIDDALIQQSIYDMEKHQVTPPPVTDRTTQSLLKGKIPHNVIRKEPQLLKPKDLHALLIIGYDSTDDCLIVRDVKSSYAMKGFMKIPVKPLHKNFNSVKLIATVIDSIDKTPINRSRS